MNLAIQLNDWWISQLAACEAKTEAQRILKRKGYSYRTAAPLLGITHTHLFRCLTGERHSERVLAGVEELPTREEVQP